MKLPLSEKLFAFCANNPALVVLVLALAIPATVIYVAGEVARSSPHNFTMYAMLGMTALIYSGYLATLALRYFKAAGKHDG